MRRLPHLALAAGRRGTRSRCWRRSPARGSPRHTTRSPTPVSTAWPGWPARRELGQAMAFAGPRTALAGPAGWGRGKQVGIQPQAGDQADVAAHRGDQVEAGEVAIADDGDGALGQPTSGLEDRLDGPAGQRLVAP